MSIEIFSLSERSDKNLDVFIFAVGYESRSLHLLSDYGARANLRLAYVFEASDKLSSANRAKMSLVGHCEIIDYSSILHKTISERNEKFEGRPLRIAVDISSMSRQIMALTLSQLFNDDFFKESEIQILYSVAKFSPPAADPPDAIDFSPIPEFAGWTTSPERPVIMIVGLGYETDHAIGVMEYLDPSATFAFFPEGIDERFSVEVIKANEPLIEMLKTERRVPYPVMDPLATYWVLRSLVSSVLDSARVVLVPMGPKIFVSLCMACQKEFGDEVSIWRASSHSSSDVKDIAAAGPVFGYVVRRI